MRARVRRSVKHVSITVTPSRPTRKPLLFSPHDPSSWTYAYTPSLTSSSVGGGMSGCSWSWAGAVMLQSRVRWTAGSVRGAFGDRQRLHHVAFLDVLCDVDPV